MEINKADLGVATVLRLRGDLDEEGVGVLRTSLLECIKGKKRNVVVDLSGTRYVSYLGIGVLLERMRQLRAVGGDMKLSGLNLFAQRTFHMASVTAMFTIHETEAQAIEGFRAAA